VPFTRLFRFYLPARCYRYHTTAIVWLPVPRCAFGYRLHTLHTHTFMRLRILLRYAFPAFTCDAFYVRTLRTRLRYTRILPFYVTAPFARFVACALIVSYCLCALCLKRELYIVHILFICYLIRILLHFTVCSTLCPLPVHTPLHFTFWLTHLGYCYYYGCTLLRCHICTFTFVDILHTHFTRFCRNLRCILPRLHVVHIVPTVVH